MTNKSGIESLKGISAYEFTEIMDKMSNEIEKELNNQLTKNITEKEKAKTGFFLLAHVVASILKKSCFKKDQAFEEILISKFMELVHDKMDNMIVNIVN